MSRSKRRFEKTGVHSQAESSPLLTLFPSTGSPLDHLLCDRQMTVAMVGAQAHA
jgi:hypothetical protein